MKLCLCKGRIEKRCIWQNVCLFAAGGKASCFVVPLCPLSHFTSNHTSDFFTYHSRSIVSQRFWFDFSTIALYKFFCMYVCMYVCNTCRVWTNFPKTIRTNKIVKSAIILFICTTKTIARLPVFWNKFGVTIRMHNHKCNEVEIAFPIFKESRLVRVHTDSHHSGHNNIIFAVSYVW